MPQKTISGFTTTYNCFDMHYPFLECIESLLGFCDEVCIADAGSTDGTIESIQELQKRDSRIKFSVEPVDFSHPRWAIYQDGYLKAKARALCTSDFCWQTDTDEIVAEHDYQKIRDLPGIIGDTPLIMLPMIEFWGSLKTIRADFFSWKPRFSINDKKITHGIPKELRCYDSNGHEYPRPFDSDSCNYIYKDTLEDVPIVIPVDTQSLKNVSLGTKEYENLFFKWLDIYPAVFHVSWLDLRRKVQHYKKLWRRFHGSMYNLDIKDDSSNNVMFEKPWSDVSELDIKNKAQELNNLGPRFFHKKMDRFKKGFVFEFNRPIPDKLINWHDNEIKAYEQTDRDLLSDQSISSPLVSAVVPVISKPELLKEAISSLVNQDYKNLEIIIVNEGNSIDTEAEARFLQSQYPGNEIRIINKKQGGISEAKNYGIMQSKGTFVFVLESEDLIRPDYVSKGVSSLKSGDQNVFYSNVEYGGEMSGEWLPENYDEYQLRYKNSIPKSAIFSRLLWNNAGGYKSNIPFGDEWDFWINCTKSGIKPAHSPGKLFIDRVFTSGEKSLPVDRTSLIQSAIIKIANHDMYPVSEVVEAQNVLSINHADWFWRCESFEKTHPEDWLIRFLLALGYEGMGQVQNALNNFGASIQFSEYKNWQPLYRLAKILEKNNQTKEAREFYHSVRTLRPDMKGLIPDFVSPGTL